MVVSKIAVTAVASMALMAFVSSAGAGPLSMCRADAARLCPGAKGKAALECLKGHVDEVSIGCGKEVKKLKAEMGK
jgi:hypothetical protein